MYIRKKTLLINLLSVRAGGQVTRAKAFLMRIRKFDLVSKIIVLSEASTPDFVNYSTFNINVVKVDFWFQKFIAFQRIVWENLFLPGLLTKNKIDVYITFAHYLPITFPPKVYSLVGVSNLAPFSEAAWNSEGVSIKIKMTLQKKSILSSAKRASSVLALSQACSEILVSNGVDEEKISVIPNGVEKNSCNASTSNEVLKKNNIVQPYLLYISHFHRYKNHIRLIDAFSLLSEKSRFGHKLVMVGQPFNNSYYNEILSKIDAKCMTEIVTVVPGLDAEDLSVLYSNATLFIFPSLIENCPNILLEAMSFSLPILSSALAPMPEFCEGAAVFFDPLSVGDIFAKLEYYIGKKDDLRLMGIRAQERSRVYSWDAFTEKITYIYLTENK